MEQNKLRRVEIHKRPPAQGFNCDDFIVSVPRRHTHLDAGGQTNRYRAARKRILRPFPNNPVNTNSLQLIDRSARHTLLARDESPFLNQAPFVSILSRTWAHQDADDHGTPELRHEVEERKRPVPHDARQRRQTLGEERLHRVRQSGGAQNVPSPDQDQDHDQDQDQDQSTPIIFDNSSGAGAGRGGGAC